MYINILELKAVHLALLKFIKTCANKDFHVQMDNIVAFTYLVKMGRTSNQQMTTIFKRIWSFLISKDTKTTTENLSVVVNMRADMTSCHIEDRS